MTENFLFFILQSASQANTANTVNTNTPALNFSTFWTYHQDTPSAALAFLVDFLGLCCTAACNIIRRTKTSWSTTFLFLHTAFQYKLLQQSMVFWAGAQWVGKKAWNLLWVAVTLSVSANKSTSLAFCSSVRCPWSTILPISGGSIWVLVHCKSAVRTCCPLHIFLLITTDCQNF
jgi:hypothetical protein